MLAVSFLSWSTRVAGVFLREALEVKWSVIFWKRRENPANRHQIEVVPFFHKMAFTILMEVGEENPEAVLATTILSYSLSAILTGIVFFAMGACGLGSLIGFFPRHILIGCIGGVGWFLVATGLEVSARLDGNLEYNFATIEKLLQLDTIFLWITPLALAILLMIAQRWAKHPLFVPCYFLVIPAVFYLFVAAIPHLQLDELRELGWVFNKPAAGVPFYHFYTLYGKLPAASFCTKVY
jgi:SulP family sulfate permease